MNSELRFVLSGYYGCGNTGDEAVLAGIVESFARRAGKDARMGILYMSGYPDNPAGPPGQEVRDFLHKPFTPDALLLKVRQSLDSRANGARG